MSATPPDVSELAERLRLLDLFLRGKGPVDGLWFGDSKKMRNGYRAKWWWRRSHLGAVPEAAILLESLATENARLTERVAALEGALEPFADAGEELLPESPTDMAVIASFNGKHVRLSDLRRARNTLKDTSNG